jgi:hypothetical protein
VTPSKRRLVLAAVLVGAFAGAFFAFRSALVPATHADHDHGILNLDAGGYLEVETRDGRGRNLVGAPGKVLVVTFVDPADPSAADELRRLFAFQESRKGDTEAEVVVLVKTASFESLDAWLAGNGLVPPVPASLTVDPEGRTTLKFNNRRPVETMLFGPDGKLASQARGRLDWALDAPSRIAAAAAGEGIH